jgi:hypothetical protein
MLYGFFVFRLHFEFRSSVLYNSPMKTKPDLATRKALLAARILLRERAGRLTARDRRWAGVLAKDQSLNDRLVEIAVDVLRFSAVFSRSRSESTDSLDPKNSV